jgi:hypothetical protein
MTLPYENATSGLVGKRVRIWSREHGAWWRPDGCGYTTHISAAGIYEFEDAWKRSQHCDHDKGIVYEVVEPMSPDPVECFEALKPALAELTRCIRTAPCNRAGLAVLVAVHAFAIAGQEMGKDTFANAREIADIIVEVMQSQRPALKVVS